MYHRAKVFLELLRTPMTVIGFLAGIVVYGTTRHMYHRLYAHGYLCY